MATAPKSTAAQAAANEEMRQQSSRALPTDHLNRRIIEMLQDDGRLPYDVIASSLGVSAGTVRNRVNRMRDAGMLNIVAVVDPKSVDYATDCMLGVKVAGDATPKSVADRLSEFQEVVYIIWISGRFDLLVEVVCDQELDFRSFLDRHIFGAKDIASVEVMSNIQMFKNQFLLKRHFPAD